VQSACKFAERGPNRVVIQYSRQEKSEQLQTTQENTIIVHHTFRDTNAIRILRSRIYEN
jgi:hypothetical protein